MAPDDPNWADGYVPTSAEWNAQFAQKVDYPAPVEQGGTGGTTPAEASDGILCRELIATTPFPAQKLFWYGLNTATGALTINLPALSTCSPGDWIQLVDVDYQANSNNVTLDAFGSDVIALYDASAGTQTLDVAGVAVVLIVNTSSWRMIVI